MDEEKQAEIQPQHRDNDQPARNIVIEKPSAVVGEHAESTGITIADKTETKATAEERENPWCYPEDYTVIVDPV